MTVTVTHTKTDTIADWTQADVDAQIVAGNLPPGTLLADVVLPSDWNANHTLVGMDAIELNIRGIALINMGGGNYTMTDDEAQSAAKLIVNEGVGSTLTYPTTSDSTTPVQQVIFTGLAANAVILSDQTGGNTTTIPAGLITQIAYSADGFITDFMPNYSANARAGINGVSVKSANYTAVAGDVGTLIVFDTAACFLTISPASTTEYGANAIIRTVFYGAGECFVSAGVGVTLNGLQNIYHGQICEIIRSGSTDTWNICSVNNGLINALDDNAGASPVYPLWSNTITGISTPQLSSTKLSFVPDTGTLTTDVVVVDDEAYGAGWDADLSVPTKNAIYDKIESGLTLGKSIGISSQYLALN